LSAASATGLASFGAAVSSFVISVISFVPRFLPFSRFKIEGVSLVSAGPSSLHQGCGWGWMVALARLVVVRLGKLFLGLL
jgi:hypothetical protein